MKEIKFSVNKKGTPIAHYYSRRQMRWFPIAHARAERLVEQGDAYVYDPKQSNVY